MKYNAFKSSWPALYLWATSLEKRLAGQPFLRSYTHRKSELVLHFGDSTNFSAVTWQVRGNQARLAFYEKATLPRKRVEIFNVLPAGLILEEIQIHAKDRALRIELSEGHSLLFGFYPAIMNVFMGKDGVISDHFLGSPPPPENLSDDWIGMVHPIPTELPGKLGHTDLLHALQALRVLDDGELELGPGEAGVEVSMFDLERTVARKTQSPITEKTNLQRLTKQGSTLRARWQKKLKRLKQELVDAQGWPEMEIRLNDLKMALAMRLEVSEGQITIPADLSSTGVLQTIALEQNQSVLMAIESLAKRIRKSKAKLDQLVPMIEGTELDLSSLNTCLEKAEIDELHAFLQSHGEIMDSAGKRNTERKPYKLSKAPSGADILVGRTSRDNDTLTFKVAAKHDWWFHARGVRGSHVILRTGRSEPSQADILRAAELAALNSKAKHSGIVVVQYCQRKHLTKPKGSAPGAVLVHQEKSITVDLDLVEGA